MPTCNLHGEPIMYKAEKCPACEESYFKNCEEIDTYIRLAKQIQLLSAQAENAHYVHVEGQGNPPGLTAKTTTFCGECEKKDKIIELMARHLEHIGNHTKERYLNNFTAQAEKELADG